MSAQKAPKMNIIDRSSFWSDLGLGDSDNNSGNNNNNNSGNNSTTNNSSTDIDWASWLSGGGGDSSSAASMSGPSTPNNQIINGNQSPSKYSMNNNLNGMGNNGMGNNNNMRFNNNNNGMNNNNNNSGSSSDADWSNLASWLGDIGGGNGNNNSNNNNFDNMSIQSGGSWQSNNSGNMNNNMMNMNANGNFNKGNGKKGNMNFNNKGNNGKNNNMGNNGKDSFWLSKDITNNQNLNGSNGGPGGSIDGFKLYKNEDFSSDLLNLYDDVTDEDVVEWISHYTLDTGAREKFWRIDSLDRRRIVGHGPISGDNSSASLMARVAQLNCRKRQVGQIGARYGSQYIGSGTRGNSIVGVTQPNGPGPGGPYHSDKNGKKGMKNGGNGGMMNKGGKNNWNKDPWSIMDKGNNINGGNNWNNNGMNMNNNIMGNNNGMNNNMNNNGGDMNNWMNQNNGGKDNNMWGNNNNNNGGKWGNNMGKGNMNNNMNNNGGDWNNNNGNIMNNNGMNNMNNGKGDQWNNNNNFFGNNGNGKNQNNNMGKDNNGNFNNNMNQNNMGKGNNMDNNMNNNMSNNNNMNNNGNNNNGSGNGNGKDKVSYGAWLASQGPGQNQNTPDVNLGPSADIFGTPNDDMERCANDVPQFQRTGSVNLLSIQTDNLGNLGGSGINGTGTGSPKNTNGNNGGSPGTGKASERGSVDLSAKHADRITNLSNIETETNKLYENRFHAEAQALQNSNAVHNREQLLGIRVQSAFSVPYPVLAVESQHIPSQKEQQKALESGNLKEVLSVGKPVFLRINHLPEWITHSDQIKNYFSTVKTPSKKGGSGPGNNDNEEDNITDANDVVKKEETSKSGTGTDDTNATRTTSSNDLKVQASKNLKPMQGLQCISLNLEGRKVDIHFDSYANAVSAKGSKAGISLSKPVSNSSCASSSNSANNSSEEDGGPKKGSSTTSEAIAENLSGNKNNTDNTTDDSTNVVTTSEEFFIPQIEGPFRLPLFTRPISKESIAKRESINVSAPPGHHGAPSHLHMNLSGNTNLTEQFRNSSGTSSATKNSTNRRSRSPHRNQSSKSNRFSNLSPQSQKRKWLAVPEPRQEELVARNLMERGLFQGWTQKDVSSKVKEMFSEWRNNRMLQDSINTNGNGNSGSNPSSPNNTSGSKPVTYAAGGWNSSHYELNELLSVGFGGNVPSDSIDLKATAETTAEMINSILYGDDLTRDSTNANGNSAVTTTSSSDSMNNNNNMGDTDMINANDKNSDDIMAAILGKAAGPGTEKTDNNGTGDNTNMESWDSWFNNILQ